MEFIQKIRLIFIYKRKNHISNDLIPFSVTDSASNYPAFAHHLALLQEKIANRRKDDLHKMTTELVRCHDVICIEDLTATGLMRNHHLTKSHTEASFGELCHQLEYKVQYCAKLKK